MRIALVAIHPAPSPQAVPLANAFLQSYLTIFPPAEVPEIQRLDCFLEQESADCQAAITLLQAELVGFSMYVWNRDKCREIAANLRRQCPGITIFAGGPEATADPSGVLAGDAFDFLIVGEGEVPFAELCQALQRGKAIDSIPGLATRSRDSYTLIPAEPLRTLDEIPSPWLNGTLDARQYPGLLWQLSRGCGFACDFCFDSRDRHGVRRFSLERIEAELRHFAASGVNQVFVLDSTFNQDQRRAKTILRLIRKIAPTIHFHFEVRSEFIDRELAELFAAITCSLQIGLQSSDPGVLKQVGRTFLPEDFASRTMLLNDTGATFGFDLMYGLPGDSLAGFCSSLEFALDLYPNHLDIFPLAILPGTALTQRAESLGLEYRKQPPYVLLSSPTFSADDMEKAHTLASACDIFYTRGRSVAWFNGMLQALGQRPAAFLLQFFAWLQGQQTTSIVERDLTDEQIWQLQREFLGKAFSPKRLRRFLPAVLDLVDYHYHYAAALLSPITPQPAKLPTGKKLLERPLQLAESTHLALFHYEIMELLEAGAADVRGFSDSLQQSGSQAVIYPTSEGVFTESIDMAYFKLLEGLDGTTPAGTVARTCGIAADETVEFLEFALSEGIVVTK